MSTYTTAAEIEFLANLGRHIPPSVHREPITRVELLTRYRGTIPRRRAWDGLDKLSIVEAVNAMIDKEREKASQKGGETDGNGSTGKPRRARPRRNERHLAHGGVAT